MFSGTTCTGSTGRSTNMNLVAADRPLYIEGQWHAASGPTIDAYDPTTDNRLAEIGAASEEQIDSALDAARSAQAGWSKLPPISRSAPLRQIADLVESRKREISEAVVLEVGKPLAQALLEVEW